MIRVLYCFIFIVLFIAAGVVALSAFDNPIGIKLYAVQSGSMSPSIPTWSLVIIKPQSSYAKGDVITFKPESEKNKIHPKTTVTHRIFELKGEDYTTKGDANNTPDNRPIAKDQILGKVIFNLPYLGYLVSFAKTQNGFIFLIIIPAVIIIYSELIVIKNEAKKLMQERKRRKLTTEEKIKEKIGEGINTVEKDIKGALRSNKKSV